MPSNPELGPVWLVLPTYNEAANLEAIAAAILEHLPAGRRLLVVDDSSPDGTGEIADRLAASDPDVEVLHRPVKQGLGPAYVAGFRHALAGGAGLVAQMDADFSHDPADLPRLLAATADADLVLGSRYVDGGAVEEWGPGRRLISRGGSAYARAMLGLGVADLTGGFKVFRRRSWRRSIWTRSRRSATRFRSRPPSAPSAPGSASPRCRSSSTIAAWRVEDDRVDRRRGRVAGSADAVVQTPVVTAYCVGRAVAQLTILFEVVDPDASNPPEEG